MTLTFPDSFFFGTSTSAAQIETAFLHDWQGLKAVDGTIFNLTTAHERHFPDDVDIISFLGTDYRLSVMWSKLQRQPYAALDADTVAYYHDLLQRLREKDIRLMMVLHHWVNPVWFAELGGWSKAENVMMWIDYAKKVINEFGDYVHFWNTFNEPNLYVTLAYLGGIFPPFSRNILLARKVIQNLGFAHDSIYDYIKQRFPEKPAGVSHNYVSFDAENVLGSGPSRIAKGWYRDYLPGFFSRADFTGISYYARVSFDPFPVTALYSPHKLKKLRRPHDDIWEYYPEGLLEGIRHFSDRFGKPVIITENGFCTDNDALRAGAIRDYMTILHRALKQHSILGYYHWTAWDNFEWTLGMRYKFGLYACDPVTMERSRKESGNVYARLAHGKIIDVAKIT